MNRRAKKCVMTKCRIGILAVMLLLFTCCIIRNSVRENFYERRDVFSGDREARRIGSVDTFF